MKVLHLTNMYPLPGDPAFGCFVEMLTRAIPRVDPDIECDVYFINGQQSTLNYLKAIGGALRGEFRPYDLIHSHYHYSGIVASFEPKVPLVAHFHGCDVGANWGHLLLSRGVAWRAAATIVGNRRMQTKIPGAAVIPIGPDLQLFRSIAQAEARKRLGLPLDARIVLFPARKEHGVKRFDRFELTIGLLGDIPGLLPIVMGDLGLPRQLIPCLMAASDVVLLTSDREGGPLVVREALLCSVPVVMTDVGESRELSGLVGEYCQVVCAKDPSALAVAVRKAFSLNRETLVFDRDQLGLEASARMIANLYHQLLG